MIWQGPAIVADGSTELRKRLPAALFGEWFGPGSSRRGLVVHGRVWLGLHWSGNRCRRQHWGACSPLLLSTESGCAKVRFGGVRLGKPRYCVAGRGWFWHGEARQWLQRAALRVFGLSLLLFNESSQGVVCHGEAGRCKARCGCVGSGLAALGNSCRRQHGGLMLSLLLSMESGCGLVRFGGAGKGRIGSGSAWRGSAKAADGSTERLRALSAALRRSWRGSVGSA